MNKEEISELWGAIKILQNKLDEIICEKAKVEWVTIDTLASMLGMTLQGVHYRLFHTQGIEPEVDFVKINNKYHITPSAIPRLKR